jgi:hypothetical protein
VLNVLGLIGLIVFCAAVIVIAAVVTWAVVKFSPAKRPDEQTR